MTVYVTSTFAPLIGRPRIAVRLPVPKAVATVSRVIGAVKPTLFPQPDVYMAVSPIVGRTRIKCLSNVDSWTSAGYPLPSRDGYGVTGNAGLKRTLMRSGKTRQRRRWTAGHGTADISIDLPTSLLNKFEYDISRYGYNWFTMPMVTGANSSLTAESHTVRIIGDVTKGELFGENIKISFPIEFIQTQRAGISTPFDGPGASAKTLSGSITSGGTLVQTVFPLSIRAVETYPSTSVSREYFMEVTQSKTLSGLLASGGNTQSTSEDTKTLSGLILAGSALSQETHKDILNGSGTYYINPLEASVNLTTAMILGGSLQNYVNEDVNIHSVPSGGNYLGTDDTQTMSGLILSGGALTNTDTTISYVFDGGNYTGSDDAKTLAGLLLSGGVLSNTDTTISYVNDGGNYTGTDDAKTLAAVFSGGAYTEVPEEGVPESLVITTSNLGGYFMHENDSSAKTWAGNFNGGTLQNTDNTISSISDGGNYMGTSDTKTWAGNFNGGILQNTDNTISAISDGGNYTGTNDAKTWAANFNGGLLHGPLSWIMAENLFWIEPGSVTARFVGVRVTPVENKSIITAIRVRGATASTTVSNVFITINGAYTLLVSSATVGTDWTEIAIAPMTVPAGATVELAMTTSTYTWVENYYAGSPILEGFEAASQANAWIATDDAFGIDLKFAQIL